MEMFKLKLVEIVEIFVTDHQFGYLNQSSCNRFVGSQF